MTKQKNRPQLLTIVFAVLLVAALAVIGWLYSSNTALQQQVTALEEEVAAAEKNLTGTTARLEAAEAALAETEAELSAAQSDLAEMTAAKDAAEAQVAELTVALDGSNAQLAQATAEKEAADAALAALGYAPIKSPTVVESLPEEPVEEPIEEPVEEPIEEPAEEPVEEPAEEPAEEPVEEPIEEPATDDNVCKTPVEACDPLAVTVYTADMLHVAFEAPVDWIILLDNAEDCYILRSPDDENGHYTILTITTCPAEGDEPLAVLMSATVTEGEPVPAQLLGQDGLCVEYELQNQEGWLCRVHMQAVVVDGVIYTVEIQTSPERFEADLNNVFLPFCDTLRLIP